MPANRASSHPLLRRSPAEERLAARVRQICMALPQANEKVSHGEPTWFAGKGKVFAMLDSHHHGSAHLAVWLPQPIGAQEALIDSDPARFFRPPYVGPSGWVGVILDTQPSWSMVEQLVRDAYLHVATAKLKSLLAPKPSSSSGRGDEPAASKARSRRRQRLAKGGKLAQCFVAGSVVS